MFLEPISDSLFIFKANLHLSAMHSIKPRGRNEDDLEMLCFGSRSQCFFCCWQGSNLCTEVQHVFFRISRSGFCVWFQLGFALPTPRGQNVRLPKFVRFTFCEFFPRFIIVGARDILVAGWFKPQGVHFPKMCHSVIVPSSSPLEGSNLNRGVSCQFHQDLSHLIFSLNAAIFFSHTTEAANCGRACVVQ